MVNATPLLAAGVLAGVYALRAGAGEGGILARMLKHRRAISAATGVSVAYVFLDILPELAARNQALLRAAGDVIFAEQRIYLPALISFVVMYGIDHIVLSHRDHRRDKVARREADALYWLHLGGFAAYSALIGYLLSERVERGLFTLVIYMLAMAVHFIVVGHSLAEEHGHLYRRQGHWVLAGGVVITSLRSELPDDRTGRFWPFCLGSTAFAGVLLAA